MFFVYCFESAAVMNLLASIASIRKLCRGQFFENEEEILRRGGSTERLGKSPTNKQIGDDVFLCCTTLTNNMYCRSKARLILTGEVTAK